MKKAKQDYIKTFCINATAEIENITPTSVRRVFNGKQNNASVQYTYTDLYDKVEKAIEAAKNVKVMVDRVGEILEEKYGKSTKPKNEESICHT